MMQFVETQYPNAKFGMFCITGNVNRIISCKTSIILIWMGDCCGIFQEGHSEPKTYVVLNESQFITMNTVIKTLLKNDFQVPCGFNNIVDVVPLIEPHEYNDLYSARIFKLIMTHPNLPYRLLL